MKKKKILFICGSINQTTMMHKIAMNLNDFDLYFTHYYADDFLRFFIKAGLLDFCILGGQFKNRTLKYLKENNLKIDECGASNSYDLIVTCSDLIIPNNIKNNKLILVQEGMTDPEGINHFLVKNLKLPRYLASTSMNGLSDAFDYFCIASEGYRDHFIGKGVKEEKIIVTGIPNFDNCEMNLNNNFPHKNFLLVCTSDFRETYKYEDRKKFIRKAIEIADGKQIIFKLHPNENSERARKEIKNLIPNALIFDNGITDHMIANCDSLFTRFSSVVYVAITLGKKVYSDIPNEELNRLKPIQNRGTSSKVIADVCRQHVNGEKVERKVDYMKYAGTNPRPDDKVENLGEKVAAA
jgi:galactitol-specific phosphotransferase system IIB component